MKEVSASLLNIGSKDGGALLLTSLFYILPECKEKLQNVIEKWRLGIASVKTVYTLYLAPSSSFSFVSFPIET